MLKFLFRAPLTLKSLISEVNRNRHFSVAEKVQALAYLSGLFLRQRFQSARTGTVNARLFNFGVTAYNYQTLIFLFREIFLSEAYYFKADTPKPIIVDGGANIGMSSLYFKYLYPQCQIIAFEPNPEAVALYRQNIGANNLRHITFIPFGLGNEPGEMDFFLAENQGSLDASFNSRKSTQKLKIKVEKLSGYLKFYKPELVKLDVEGAETAIVQELTAAGALTIPKQYIIEYHQSENNPEAALAAFLQMFSDAGYRYRIRNRPPATTTQDLLFHFYR